MLLIGDVHGDFEDYKNILRVTKCSSSLQLGDMGVGFPNSDTLDLTDIPGDHKWFRGNHDNPKVSKAHPNHIGDYGIINGSFFNDTCHKIMYIAGAWSIDQDMRIPDYTWWEGEQLPYSELAEAVRLYEREKPDIVCSHDCPTGFLQHMYGSAIYPTRTSQAFDSMLEIHTPKYWIFGHHHRSCNNLVDGCNYICVDSLKFIEV